MAFKGKKQKLDLGSLQKTQDGNRVVVASAYDLKNLQKLFNSKEVQDIINSNDPKKKLYFNFESKSDRLASLTKSVQDGKLSEEMAEKIEETVNKIPDYVLSKLCVLVTVDT